MKIKKTNKDLITFINVSNNVPIAAETKGSKKLAKQSKVFTSAIEKYNSDIETAQIDNCSVDEKGNILRDEKNNFIYSKEGLKKLTVKSKELQAQEVEVEVFLTAEDLLLLPASHRNYYREFLGIEDTDEATEKTTSAPNEKTNATTNVAPDVTPDVIPASADVSKTTEVENKPEPLPTAEVASN